MDAPALERLTLETAAPMMWSSSYEGMFAAEFARNAALVGSGGYHLAPSSYRARLHGERAELYDARRLRQRRDEMAVALHANNMQHWSPSLLARSVAYLPLTTSWMHSNETQQRRLASRPTTLKFLRLVRDARPEPTWGCGAHVFVYIADQTYEWVGMQKRGRRQALERHDAHGMPVDIKHQVYINSVAMRIPSVLGTLAAADISRIVQNCGSPYTEDYNLVLVPLAPRVVDASLCEFQAEMLDLVAQAAHAAQMSHQLPNLTIRQLATALFGRPAVSPGGPSEFDILEPLLDTDTKSYDDFTKIAQHLGRNSGPNGIVDVVWMDGQGIIGFKNLKARFPHLYARWLLAVGGFHEHAHFMFAITEMFWSCLCCTCFVTVLGLQQVREVTNNLEHNAYMHHQNAHHVLVLAICAYLIQDVTSPSPDLLLRDLDMYLGQVNHAGGVVLLRYLRHGGFPIAQWQRAARTGDGAKLKKLFAYSYHICRSVAHKPVCVQILLIGLLGFCCTLPSLQAVLVATCSLSLLGRNGANMYADRLLEYVNKIQQGSKRSANAASFGRMLDLTTLLRAIMHIRHAFQATERGYAESEDPVTLSQLVQARKLQDFILAKCGRDLTVHDPNNPFHHTGNAVPLYTAAGWCRQRTPWIWVNRTQTAQSAGKSRSRHERWDDHARRFVFDHFFPF